MKKIIALCSIAILVLVKCFSGLSDSSIRDRVVMLKSKIGQCSGIQVKAPSGTSYILTAGHCKPLSEDGISIPVITEGGKKLPRKIIEEDSASDLLLLEGIPGKDGISIAFRSSRFEEIRTFTHGMGHKTFQTHGLIIDDTEVGSIISMITDAKEKAQCQSQPKNRVVESFFGDLCALVVQETTITASIVPGSSGGAIVDPRGDLIGIASMGGDGLYYMVRLSDIRGFLSGY